MHQIFNKIKHSCNMHQLFNQRLLLARQIYANRQNKKEHSTDIVIILDLTYYKEYMKITKFWILLNQHWQLYLAYCEES